LRRLGFDGFGCEGHGVEMIRNGVIVGRDGGLRSWINEVEDEV
jgi:hypothetical protein